KLVAWRRGHRARPGGPLLSPFTVDDTTKQLRKLFNRAKDWGVRFEHEPQWRRHLLKEPVERVRELREDEAERLEAAMRDDLAPFFAFAMATGWRKRECLLRWSEVDFGAKRITKLGKGKRPLPRQIHADHPQHSVAVARSSPRECFHLRGAKDRSGQ